MSAIPTYGYSDTPTPLPPPPRRLHVRWSEGYGLWFLRLFITPHTLVGIGLIIYCFFLLLAVCFSTQVPGSIDKLTISHSSKRGDTYYAYYHYQAGGRTYADERDSVSKDTYNRLLAGNGVEAQASRGRGTPVTVRHFNIGSAHKSTLSNFLSQLGLAILFAAFWNGVVSLFFTMAWVLPIRARLLCKYGEATTGKLLDKQEVVGKSRTYYVTCSFTDSASGALIQKKVSVPQSEAWTAAQIGQPVTIIYSRRNPKRFTVYEFCAYQIRDLINPLQV